MKQPFLCSDKNMKCETIPDKEPRKIFFLTLYTEINVTFKNYYRCKLLNAAKGMKVDNNTK